VDRRQFLKLCGQSAVAIAATAGTSVALVESALAIDKPLVPSLRMPVTGFKWLKSLQISGHGDKSEPAFLVMRRGGDRSRFDFNAYGGLVHFVPYPGQEPIFLDGMPAEFVVSSPNVRVQVVFETSDGRIEIALLDQGYWDHIDLGKKPVYEPRQLTADEQARLDSLEYDYE
jgi:hypothetical protein